MTQGVFSGVDFDERISKNTNPTLDAKPAATSSSSGADASTAVEEGGDNAVAVNGEEEGAMISGGGDDDDTTAKPDDSSMKTDAEDFRLYSPERSFSLFIKSVPLSLKRASLMEVCFCRGDRVVVLMKNGMNHPPLLLLLLGMFGYSRIQVCRFE